MRSPVALHTSLVAVSDDPVATNPELYSVVFENERVRVLEYRDRPGDRTLPHRHPDSVMLTLSSFRRRLFAKLKERIPADDASPLSGGEPRLGPASAG